MLQTAMFAFQHPALWQAGHSLVQKEKRKINGNGTNNVFKHSSPSQAHNPKNLHLEHEADKFSMYVCRN